MAAAAEMSNLAIVGGGPAGLTAALLAAEAGHRVTLIEAGTRLGGMAASITVSGQRVDLGSHRLHPAAPADVLDLLRRLLGDDLQTRTRNGRIGLGGRLVGFPLEPLDMMRSLPVKFAAAAARDAVLSPLRSEQADTYAEVVRSRLGPAVLEWFYGPYAQKLWGHPPQELAGEIARRRISVAGPAALAGKILATRTNGRPKFLYPRYGYGQIVDELSSAAQGAGVTTMLETTVSAIVETNVDVQLTIGSQQHHFDRLFWTAPPNALAEVLARPSPLGTEPPVPHRAMVLVYLTLDTDQYTPFDAHYFPSLDVLPARISEPKNYRTGDDPSGRTVICAEVVCDVGDEVWRASPGDLAQRVISGLGRAGLPPLPLLSCHLERLPMVYPVLLANRPEARSELVGQSRRHERIAVFGRQGLVVSDNLHHVIQMAIEAVRCLDQDGSWDHTRWTHALAMFEDHIVED